MLCMALLPSFLISYGITGLIRDELKSNIDSQLIYSSGSISSNINSKIKKTLEFLDLLNKIIENRNLAPDQKIAFMVSSVEKVDNILSLSLIVKEGDKFSEAVLTEKDAVRGEDHNDLQINNEKIDLSKLPFKDEHLPYLSTPQYNRHLKAWISTVVTKANMPNFPTSYLVAQIDLTDLSRDIDNHLLSRIGILFVADSTGAKFLSSKFIVDLPDRIMADAKILLKSSDKIKLTNNYSDPKFGNYVACFSYPTAVDWVVVSVIRENSAYASVHDAFIFFSVFLVLSAFVSIIAVILFSRHLSKPIIKMAEASKTIAGGHFNVDIDYTANDSIGTLSKSLSKMSGQLKEYFDEVHRQKMELEEYSRNLEKKVEERTNDLSESNKELKKAYRRVLELNEEKNEFMGIAAHDLKNPLVAVSSFADILKDDKDLTEEQRTDFLDEIMKASSRMFFIIKNLLDVNAIEQGKLNTKMERISVRAILDEILPQYTMAAAQKNINIQTSIEEGNLEIISDYSLTLQIVQNILSNALKFSPQNKKVYLTVRSSSDSRSVEIMIKDEGPGFTEEDKKKLYSKFAHLSARPTGGEHSTGLGLSIVKKLVEMMNGRISLKSESGKGAEFIISFPKARNNQTDEG